MTNKLFKNQSDSKNMMRFQYYESIFDLNIPSQDNRQLDWRNGTHCCLLASSEGFGYSLVSMLMILIIFRISGNHEKIEMLCMEGILKQETY
jgi:hypothetical protein